MIHSALMLILAAQALAILRGPNKSHIVTLTADATGGILAAVDGSQPSIEWITHPSLCTQARSGNWQCTVPSDGRRFTAQAMTGGDLRTPSGTAIEEAKVWCQKNGHGGCPQCQFPAAPQTTPTAPRSLFGSCPSNSQVVTLTWQRPAVGGQDGYLIEISADAGATWSWATRVDWDHTSAQVTGSGGGNLQPNRNVFYRVKAFQTGTTTSLPSNVVSVTTGSATVPVPAAPSNLTATATGECYPETDCSCQ